MLYYFLSKKMLEHSAFAIYPNIYYRTCKISDCTLIYSLGIPFFRVFCAKFQIVRKYCSFRIRTIRIFAHKEATFTVIYVQPDFLHRKIKKATNKESGY